MVAEKIRSVISDPYKFNLGNDSTCTNMIEHQCSVSIGIALFNGNAIEGDEILRQADSAMYEAKNKGRNSISVFENVVLH